MIHPHTELRFISAEIGYGVFAKTFIPKGTIVYVKDSLEIEVTPKKYDKLDAYAREVVDKYSYRDERGYRIISWDFAKYVNHSCHHNTISTGYGFEIATRDILPDEEVTDEYAIFNLEQHFSCGCGSAHCRGQIKPTDFDLYYPTWDKEIQEALRFFAEVPQPLAIYIEAKLQQKLQFYLETGREYRSVRALQYKKMSISS
ncbi:SET domain-containing protein [Hugenholtzia roseola]|uniref:SET domain-containing protein n=1 Tax=Hugenholtzia roseola TaxID=1002 RepID=UPI000411BE65|nr:SET domain-containing protein-lysine N-methyltransferase [Hugenholtzia roseola]